MGNELAELIERLAGGSEKPARCAEPGHPHPTTGNSFRPTCCCCPHAGKNGPENLRFDSAFSGRQKQTLRIGALLSPTNSSLPTGL
jgi:hypothetical protein